MAISCYCETYRNNNKERKKNLKFPKTLQSSRFNRQPVTA